MSNIISIATAAKQLDMSERRVREICAEHDIGAVIPGIRGRILSPADIPRIEASRGKVGNPNLLGALTNNGGGRKPAKTQRKTTISRKSKK